MNVPNIGQGSGSGHQQPLPQPRTDAGATTAPDHRADAARAAASVHPTPAHTKASISLTQLACFDVNGDGIVDSRSAAAGGDATLLVPTTSVDLPTYEHAANRGLAAAHARAVAHARDPHADRTKSDGPNPQGPANAARTNHAVDAYHRYGDPAAPAPAAAPASAPPAAPPAGLAPGAAADLTATRPS